MHPLAVRSAPFRVVAPGSVADHFGLAGVIADGQVLNIDV